MLKSPLQPAFFINSGEQAAESFNYLEKLKAMEEQGKISQIEMVSTTSDLEYDATVYQADETDVVDDNLGILIFFKGKFVNRFDFRLGDLFKEAFFKTKFKTATTIFPYMGVIDIKKGVVLNYLGTWFKRKSGYYNFIENMRDGLRKAKLSKL